MIERLLAPIKSRIKLMIGKALISACKGSCVDLKLLAGESREDVDFYQQYGFTSRPKGVVGAVALFIGGSRDNGAVVASRGEDADMNVDLEDGEVAIHSSFGSRLVLKNDGSILAVPAEGMQMRVEGHLHVVGNILSTGDVAALCQDVGGVMVDFPAVHLTKHVHPSAVGPTSNTTGP